MKNLIFALVLLVLCISCTEEASQPAVNNDTKTYEKWFYEYDETMGIWEDQPSAINIVKSIPSKSPRKYYRFADCYGTNWLPKMPEEKNGIIKEIVLKNSYPEKKINFKYDSKNYIIEEYESTGNYIEWSKVYVNKNGKLESCTDYDSQGQVTYLCEYEYDASGYISKIYNYDEQGDLVKLELLDHDDSGYLTYCMAMNSQGEIIKETYYSYYGNGLIAMESSTNGNTVYTYDVNKRLIEINIENNIIYSYVYNADGTLREMMTELYTGDKLKTVYKYK